MAICPRGLEGALLNELTSLGVEAPEMRGSSVWFHGELEDAYRVVLWSRVASRVLAPIQGTHHVDNEGLYEAVRAIDWTEHMAPGATLAVEVAVSQQVSEDSARFLTLRVKDAIVDRIREERGTRPNVDARTPDVRVHVHLGERGATISVDVAGGSLHRRGYRTTGGEAPMKEHLAAGLLVLAGWPERAAKKAPFLDPFCGSGTLALEAASMALCRAPGLQLQLRGWTQHDPALWRRLVTHAESEALRDVDFEGLVEASDDSAGAIDAAARGAKTLGVERAIRFVGRELKDLPSRAGEAGLMVTNPPYGARLSTESRLAALYETIGDVARRQLLGWDVWIYTGSRELAKKIGLAASERFDVPNGPIQCQLIHYSIANTPVRGAPGWRKPSAGSEAFANRLKKNIAHWGKWARRNNVEAYRVYDADLPEYAVAIDLYKDYAHVQEYAPPATVDPGKAQTRLRDVRLLVPELLGFEPSHVFVKTRARQNPREGRQYEKRESDHTEVVITENGHKFLVNISDYLDTGIFLDQRDVRRQIGELSEGKRFLNLFCYTGSASVYAAKNGARSTTSVDLSNTYLAWAERNFDLNGLSPRTNRMERADVLTWLPEQKAGSYDFIFMSPPTFSTSKKMGRALDVRRDHEELIEQAMRLLARDGVLLFSTHATRFKLAEIANAEIRNETERLTPPDFKRSKPHRSWLIKKSG